ncbi:MAG: hypothetical protein R3182_05785, partial [Draconibacterium sp.]|nr:hypothetical protein [Draconibacterium sp.]
QDLENANHPQIAKLNHPNILKVKSGEKVSLDASVSTDPDDNKLSYEWIYYREAGTYPSRIELKENKSAKLSLIAPKVLEPKEIHFVVVVTDNGKPNLTRYQRVIINVIPE